MRPPLVLAAALLLAGCGGGEMKIPKPPTPQPAPRDIPEVRSPFVHGLISRRKVSGVRMKVFNAGSVVARGGAVSSIKSWLAKVKLDIPFFVVTHPSEGAIVFDTGMHPEMESDPKKRMGRVAHFIVPFKAARGQNAGAQLRREGIDPAEVRWVVISHLHMDHAGMIDGFPNATVIVDKREWVEQKAKQAIKKVEREFDPAEYEGKIKSLRLLDLSGEPSYGAFDHGLDLFKDGTLVLVDLSGHTPGNMGLWANLDEGPALLAGDASWILDNHQDLALPIKGHIHDLDQYWRRLYQMRAMQEAIPRLVIFPGHDLQPLKLQPRSDIVAVPFPR